MPAETILRRLGPLVAITALLVSCRHALDPSTAGPDCGLSTSTLVFDTVTVGASADRSVSLSNTGGGVLTGEWVSPSAEFSIVGPPRYAIAAGATDTFIVRFSPAAAGTRTADLATGTSSCANVVASGVARSNPQGTPDCSLSSTSLDFGSVHLGESADRSFTITNTGAGTLSGTVTSPDDRFVILGGPGYTLVAGATGTFFVRFTPVASGVASASLATGSSICPSVAVSGSTPDPICSLSATTLDFGIVALGDSLDRSFTITNTGDGDLAGRVTVPAGDFRVVGTQAYSLRAGGTAPFTVRFKPTGTGPQSVMVATDSPLCPTITALGGAQAGLKVGDILVADDAGIVIVDPGTGSQRLLSPSASSGGGFMDITSSADGALFGIPSIGGYVYQVDPASGTRTPITFLGYLQYPETIDLAPDGYLYVVDDGSVLVRVDPASGEQRVVVRGGISAFTPAESGFGYITLYDSRTYHLNRVELATGRTTIVSSTGFSRPGSLAMDRTGNVLLTDGSAEYGGTPIVWRINPVSGGAAQVSAGGQFMNPSGVTVDANDGILVADYQHLNSCDPLDQPLTCPGALFRIDPVTGAQTLLSEKHYFSGPRGIAIYRGPGAALARGASHPLRSATWMRQVVRPYR